MSVVSSALQQILVRRLQLRFSVSALELLSRTSLLQASSLVLVGPFIDYLMTQAWVFNYEFTARAAVLLLVSNLLALLVNMSQYLCLGRFSAVSFQVMHVQCILLALFLKKKSPHPCSAFDLCR